MIDPKDLQLTGYRRPDARFGVRNHVLIIPVDDLSNAAAEAVAHNVRGTMALPHPYGRLQFGADLDLTFRTLAGQGRNPNCARQLSAVGYADTQPVASNDTDEGRSANRRIEIVLYPKDLKENADQVETGAAVSQ